MKKHIKRNIEIGVLFGLVCAIALSFARFEARCDQLRKGVLRLHIIANSDSQADQALKLAVRDEILKNSTNVFKNCNSVDDAIVTAGNNIDAINKIANQVVKEKGFNYSANVSVSDQRFDTREYQNFTLPAGTYKSLVIRLGDAKGKNWWCVVFPCVCVPGATDSSLSDTVPQQAVNVAQNAQEYEIKFKTVEIYEKIKQIFSKK